MMNSMTMPITDVKAHLLLHSRVDPSTGCWIWTRSVTQYGYGRFKPAGRGLVLAHVAAYQEFVGPVPEGLELDHLCRVPACLNPKHLEPVTHQENVRRGKAGVLRPRPDICKNGHELSGRNVMPRPLPNGRLSYRCRTCHNIYGKKSKSKAAATRHTARHDTASPQVRGYMPVVAE